MDSARRVAYDALKRIDADGAYANLVLGAMLDRSELSDMDRRFVTDLVYGTTRMRRACDALVDRFITTTPDPATRTLLRLGAYQLEFAGVPPHAAVGETVGLAPKRVRGVRERRAPEGVDHRHDLALGTRSAQLPRLDR